MLYADVINVFETRKCQKFRKISEISEMFLQFCLTWKLKIKNSLKYSKL